MTNRTLLITGFDPFGGETVNPSWAAVKQLPQTVKDFTLCKLPIQTVYGQAAQTVLTSAKQQKPDVILCIGQAGGRDAVTPERIAVNIRHARIPDNAGNQPQGQKVVADGPAAYFSTLPVEAMSEAIKKAGIPSCVSNHAGTFVCNDVLYTLLHHYRDSETKVGFVHVPYLPAQGKPNLSLEQITDALIAAISAF